jgi:hypothetical protein
MVTGGIQGVAIAKVSAQRGFGDRALLLDAAGL